jgi:hypothetical protein
MRLALILLARLHLRLSLWHVKCFSALIKMAQLPNQ